MKKLLLILLIPSGFPVFAQDTLKLQRIDSLVADINRSAFTVTQDSVIQDFPKLGLKINNYLTAVFDGAQLKKYINRGYTKTVLDSTVLELTTISTFYFHSDQLIKVEESGSGKGTEILMNWYYEESQPIFWTRDNERATERAALLLTIGKGILNTMSKGK